MDTNLLTSYCFLATLAENNSDIFESVYIPLCKRCLSRIACQKKQGSHFDVQKQLLDDFGLNVPEEIVRQLLVRIHRDSSRREKKTFGFTIMDKGKFFQFEDYSYDKIEEKYNQIKRGANALEEAFQEYVKAQGEETLIPFQDFIDSNKHKLSSYFLGKKEPEITDQAFFMHAKFLRKIENSHHELYKAAEKSYLGSIIAAYFESGVNVEAKQDRGVVYYLDTRVIFEILDLQDPESTKPAQDLLELIKKTGGKPRVLSITINEMTEILRKELVVYNITNPKTTIGDACKRRKIKKISLVNLHGNLVAELQKRFDILMDPISELSVNKYEQSKDVLDLKAIGYRPSNALHDVAAYLFVRDKRSLQSLVQKVDYWFVTVNERLCSFNKRKVGGKIPEIILASELTSLLFLRNPKEYANVVSSKGLAALIAQTLTDEFADRDLINQFDDIIREKINVSDDDYELLIRYLSTESTGHLHSLIEEVSTKEISETNLLVQDIINKTRAEKEQEQQTLRILEEDKDKAEEKRKKQEVINRNLESRLRSSELQVASVAEALKRQDEEILKLKKINRRWLYVLIGILILGFSVYFTNNYIVSECIKQIFIWIKGAAGLWAFGNLIINLISKIGNNH